jgi:TolB-like protein/DNA-binding winged helix-turn-helix (wHTH) protein/tetratricopeptide (TPR) repeat protein
MEKRVVRFDGWRVDFDSGEISKDGKTHRLQDQPLQILDELLKRRGEVVTREQLIARLWPTGIVEFDTGLNSAMRKLRIALGDDAETPRYIETLPRKGYRFIAPLEPEPTNPSLPVLPVNYVPTPYETGAVIGRRASDRRAPLKRLAWGFGSLIVAAVLAIIVWHMPGGLFEGTGAAEERLPTIVVLPLVDMSVDQKDQALCDGLTEELSNWLAHIPTLRVVARTSAFAFKGRNLDVREIAAQLNATHILEGSLRRSGNQLRITVQLIEAARGLHIWSDSFDLPIGDIFLIEDTVSRSVAEALHLELSADIAERWAQRRSDTTEALEYYLLGKQRHRRRTADDNLKAIEFYRRAIEADPNYSLGLVGLSETLLNGLSLNRMPLEDVVVEVEPLINRALAISPKLAEAYAAKGLLLTEQFKFDEALPLLEKATQLNPNDAGSHRFIGSLYDRRAQPNKALEHFSLAATLDPRDFLPQVWRCVSLTDLGEFRDASAACDKARELNPSNLWGPLATAWVARAQGKPDDAIRWIDEALKLAPTDFNLADQKLDLLLTLGQFEEARKLVRELPASEGFFNLAREAQIVLANEGSGPLREWMAKQKLAEHAATGAELAELARLQFVANDAAAARATLAHANRILPTYAAADMFDGSQIRHEYAVALTHAGIELKGGGDAAKAQALLKDFDAMLDRYEQSGGTHYGLYSLRAVSLGMQGKREQAEDALKIAWQRGWRSTWKAQREPYLSGLEIPGGK